jgi:hypothetical protein
MSTARRCATGCSGCISTARSSAFWDSSSLKRPISSRTSAMRPSSRGLEAPDRDVTFVELNSLQGHDSFLVDMDNYRPIIAEFFA